MIVLHADAHALRPVRLVGDALRVYTATTFPRDPWAGCDLVLRRCAILGYLQDDGSGLLVDVLDRHGDIVQDFPLGRQGLQYLRRCLHFRVEQWETRRRSAVISR